MVPMAVAKTQFQTAWISYTTELKNQSCQLSEEKLRCASLRIGMLRAKFHFHCSLTELVIGNVLLTLATHYQLFYNVVEPKADVIYYSIQAEVCVFD